MALTLISIPGSIHFARNPAIVQLRADQDGSGTLFDAVGKTKHLEYTPTGRFDTNETITVTYDEPDGTSETVVFTAKASPSGLLQFYDAAFGGTDTEYWDYISDLIAAHPRIAPFLRVWKTASGGNKLNFRLKNTEAGWDVEVTNTGGFTVSETAATADATPENYKAKLEVYFERTYAAGDYTLAAQLDGIPETGTGYVYFDLSSVLSAECRAARAEPLVPQFGTDAPFLADNFRKYYFRYTEEYGAPVVVQEWGYANDTIIVYDGGVSQARFAEGDFLGAMDDEDALLTWMPDGKKVAMQQPEYLTFFNHGATATMVLRVVWYDITDGTASSPTDYFSLLVPNGTAAVFPVWPELFGLDSEPNAYKYTVQVGHTAVGFDDESQERTYYIDREYYESERYLMYLNSFGVPETCRCTGEWGKRLKVDRFTAEKPLLPGYNELASDRFQYGRLWDNELTYRTGFLTKDEAEVLQELLIAGEVYDVSADGYIPLQITSDSFRVTETRQELHSYEFTAQPRLNMKNYSKKKLSTLLTDAWLDEFGQPWFDAFTVAWEVP